MQLVKELLGDVLAYFKKYDESALQVSEIRKKHNSKNEKLYSKGREKIDFAVEYVMKLQDCFNLFVQNPMDDLASLKVDVTKLMNMQDYVDFQKKLMHDRELLEIVSNKLQFLQRIWKINPISSII